MTNQTLPTRSVTRVKGGVSWTRVLIAFCTLGLSLPFLGYRSRDRVVTRFR